MSLDKAIASGKEHRKSWRKINFAKYIDKSCRNHGECPYCKGNRLYNSKKRLQKANYQENDL